MSQYPLAIDRDLIRDVESKARTARHHLAKVAAAVYTIQRASAHKSTEDVEVATWVTDCLNLNYQQVQPHFWQQGSAVVCVTTARSDHQLGGSVRETRQLIADLLAMRFGSESWKVSTDFVTVRAGERVYQDINALLMGTPGNLPKSRSQKEGDTKQERVAAAVDAMIWLPNQAQPHLPTGCVAAVKPVEDSLAACEVPGELRHQLLADISRFLVDVEGPDRVVQIEGDYLVILFPTLSRRKSLEFLRVVEQRLMHRKFCVGDHNIRVTPCAGLAETFSDDAYSADLDKAKEACLTAETNNDLLPLDWDYTKTVERRATKSASSDRHPLRVRAKQLVEGIAPLFVFLVIPFFVYLLSYDQGVPIVRIVYPIVVLALTATALSIVIECFAALRDTRPPVPKGKHYDDADFPKATAIIAAYLPNEASTVVETVDNLLNNAYPDLEVILAYNTPKSMPVEETLRQMAEKDPRFVPLRVRYSTSKAQNVNAALDIATGRFTAIFDADHQPQPGSFRRAWLWLDNGYDVVQGHSVVRNGEQNWVTKTVAVEFESIYAVSHPGRTRVHDFGLFGGSNGYWRTELLRDTRMQGFMLTEDIDSSLRVFESGHQIATDRNLISTELAPTNFRALWDQRTRWAQGWFQVTLRHLKTPLVKSKLTLSQRFGSFMLLPYREMYLWISLQVFPIIAFSLYRIGFGETDWIVPIFVLSTLFTMSVGPIQTLFAYLLANPTIKQHKSWFWFYLMMSTPWYTELKNQISRTAQAKEVLLDRKWKVTPRD